MNRRGFLRTTIALASVSSVIAACAPAPAPTAQVVEKEKIVEKVVTQVVEKEKIVEKPVEKVVEKQVEKVVTATVPPATPKPAQTGPVEVRILTNAGGQWGGWMAKAYDADVDGFKTKTANTIKPKLETVVGYENDMFPRVFSQLATGTLPDIIWYNATFRSQMSWTTDRIPIMRPLDDIMKAKNYDPKAQFFAGALEESTREGKLYWLNYTGEPAVPVLAFNKTKIEKMGLALPPEDATCDEMVEWGKKATTKDVFGFSRGHASGNPKAEAGLLKQFGCQMLDAAGKKVTLLDTKPQFIAALQWCYDLIYTHKVQPMPGDPDAGSRFVSETLLSFACWPAFLAILPQQLVKDKFQIDWRLYPPLVKKGEKRRSRLNQHVHGISRQSKVAEQAFDYLAWITSKEFAVQGVMAGMGAPICRTDFWNDDRVFKTLPGYKVIKDMMLNIEPDYLVGNYRGEEFVVAFLAAWQSMELNKLKPAEAAEKIVKDSQVILDKAPA